MDKSEQEAGAVAETRNEPHRLKAKTKTKAKVKTAAAQPAPAAGATPGARASFLVRIWQVPSVEAAPVAADAAAAGWRGVVEHIQSGSKLHFADERAMFGFMVEQARRQQSHISEEDDFDQFSPSADD